MVVCLPGMSSCHLLTIDRAQPNSCSSMIGMLTSWEMKLHLIIVRFVHCQHLTAFSLSLPCLQEPLIFDLHKESLSLAGLTLFSAPGRLVHDYWLNVIYCRACIFCMPFISQISWPWHLRENNGSQIFISYSTYIFRLTDGSGYFCSKHKQNVWLQNEKKTCLCVSTIL